MFLHIDPEAGSVLVAGAGPVGVRKVRTLLGHGFAVRWVTGDQISPEAQRLVEAEEGNPRLALLKRIFAPQDLQGCWLAVAATSSEAANAEIAELATRSNRLCVRADQNSGPVRMVAQREINDFGSVAVTTAGRAPALARTLADWLGVLLSGKELKRLTGNVAEMAGGERRAWGAATRSKLGQESAKELREAGDRWFAEWLPREARK